MSASTVARDDFRAEGEIQFYLMGAVKINKGTMVSLRTDGYLYPARSGTATDIFAGVAVDTVDNSAGVAGALSCRVWKRGSFQFALASAVQANVGAAVYAADDQDLTTTSTSNQLVGYVQQLVDSSDVRIRIDRAVQ